MVLPFGKNIKKYQRLLNVQEVYTLWDYAKTKYNTVESLNLYLNFVHDTDFKKLLTRRLTQSRKEISHIEKILSQYKIKAPKPFRKEIQSAINTEAVTDEYIATILLFTNQELIEMTLRAFRSSSTNDDIRNFFKKYTLEEIRWLDVLVKYFKSKGWMDRPAIYPNIPTGTTEKVDCGEAFNLWDHLTFRYANIEITEIYHVLALDGDFKMMLKHGIQDILKKEVKQLEAELKKFGIPFPRLPKTLYKNLKTVEIPDESMYTQVFLGMQTATVVHAQALKQSTTNDRIRNFFVELLQSEMNVLDNVIKYGKIKGWLEQAPDYSSMK